MCILGNFVGPLTFLAEEKPLYTTGLVTCLATSIVAAFVALTYRYYCLWDNKKRDKSGVLEGFDHAYEDDLTDKTVGFPGS
jgi:uncharacterized membrane-anchored protein